MHHCIADGIALAQVMLSLTDPSPDGRTRTDALADAAAERARAARGPSPGPAIARCGRRGSARRRRSRARALHAATSPAHAAELAGGDRARRRALVRLLLTPADAATALKGEPRISRRVAWTGRCR